MHCAKAEVGVYIAFLGIAAFFMLLDPVYERLPRQRLCWFLGAALFGAIFMFGARDQTTQPWKPEYEKITGQYAIDRAFVSQLEKRLPPYAMVLQLPYVSFLTTDLPHDIQQHDHLRLYLHSTSLRWSYGAIVWRPADQWLRKTTAQETDAMLERVCLLGFAGVLVDRLGYAHAGEEENERFQSLLEKRGFDSPDAAKPKRLARFSRRTPAASWRGQEQTASFSMRALPLSRMGIWGLPNA
jgi:hypothetical protein